MNDGMSDAACEVTQVMHGRSDTSMLPKDMENDDMLHGRLLKSDAWEVRHKLDA
jgi:hypothetical protein